GLAPRSSRPGRLADGPGLPGASVSVDLPAGAGAGRPPRGPRPAGRHRPGLRTPGRSGALPARTVLPRRRGPAGTARLVLGRSWIRCPDAPAATVRPRSVRERRDDHRPAGVGPGDRARRLADLPACRAAR